MEGCASEKKDTCVVCAGTGLLRAVTEDGYGPYFVSWVPTASQTTLHPVGGG